MISKTQPFRPFYKSFFPVFMLILLTKMFFLQACNNFDSEEKKQPPANELKESLLEANKKAVKTEDQQIRDFVKRYQWKVTETGSGLRYLIYENGSGKQVEEGKLVTFDFSISLLNGTTVYASRELGPKEFVVGKGGVESGLEEGILYLKEGDRAKFILPSHLAFGLAGDQDKIPPKTTIIYDIHLSKVR